MKKKIFIGIVILLFIAVGAGYMYLDSILTKIVLSTLNSQYGLRVEMSDLQIGPTPGWVTIENPKVFDSKQATPRTLANAGSISINVNMGKIMSGQVDVQELRSSDFAIDLVEWDSQRLNWSDVIPRFLPETQTVAVAQPSSTEPAEPVKPVENTPIPPVIFKNFQINFNPYSTNSDQSYQIKFGELTHDRDGKTVTIKELSATQNNSLLSTIESAEVENLFQEDDSKINTKISGVYLNAEETGNGEYNFNDVMNAWMRVFDEISALVPSATPAQTETSGSELPLGKFTFANVDIHAKPANAGSDTESSVNLKLQEMEYDHQSGGIVLSGLDLQEAGQPAVHLDKMSLTYDMNEQAVRFAEVQGVKIDVRESSNSMFNVNRVVTRIQHLINALIPKDPAKTANATPAKPMTVGNLKANDVSITYHSMKNPSHKMQWDTLVFSNDTNLLNLRNFVMGSDSGEAKPYLVVPVLDAVPVKDSNFAEWDSFKIDGLQSAIVMTAEGMDISPTVAEWISFATSFGTEQSQSASSSNTAMPFRSLQLSNADFHVTDNRIDPAVTHLITPVNINWKQIPNNKAALTVALNIVSPGKGSFTFTGESSRDLYPVTVSGKPTLTIENITAYQTFYQGSLPVTIVKSGLNIDGDLNITSNQLDSSINLTLLQPEFAVATGVLPVKVDGLAVVSTLNSLKNKDGVIVFANNKISGDISQPQFSFGTSIANILTKSILNRGLNIITLPKDMAEGGVGVIKKGADAVGGILGGILKPKQ